MSALFLIILFAIPLILYILKNLKNKNIESEQPLKNKKKKKNEVNQEEDLISKTTTKDEEIKEVTKNSSKNSIVNSFRETKGINNYFFSYAGDYLVFHDEKKFCLVYLNNPLEKDIKRYSKNIDNDIIAHVSFSSEKKIMAVGLKNSKDILFYALQKEDETGKVKFVKLEKKVHTERKFDIKNISISSDGDIVASSGFGQDTEVQIYSYSQSKLIGAIDINGIENIEMKMSPDSKFITVSTFMYEIAVIGITKATIHIKNSTKEETSIKVSKKNFYSLKYMF